MTATLRKLAFGTFLAVSAFSTVTMTSCKKDETCDAGYEGSDCKTEVRAKFLGTWTANDVTNSKPIVYSVPVTSGGTVTQILMGNFSDFFENAVTANVSGTTFDIPEQRPDGSTSIYTVKGSGSIANNVITINYTITGAGVTQNYTGTWRK